MRRLVCSDPWESNIPYVQTLGSRIYAATLAREECLKNLPTGARFLRAILPASVGPGPTAGSVDPGLRIAFLQASRDRRKRGAAAPRLPMDARRSRTSSSESTFQGGGRSRPARLAWPPPPYLRGRKSQPPNKQTTAMHTYLHRNIYIIYICINTCKYAFAFPPSSGSTLKSRPAICAAWRP